MTYDTLTVGLGEDVGPVDAAVPKPAPVLARVPRVVGLKRRVDRPRATASAGDLRSFEVTTSQPTALAAPPVGRPAEKVAGRAATPRPEAFQAAQTAASKDHEGWAATLLKLLAGGRATRKLAVWVLLIAIAGASLLMFRMGGGRGSDVFDAGPAPEWDPAPLAGPAPLFVPEPVVAQRAVATPSPLTELAGSVSVPTPGASPVAEAPAAVGPIRVARRSPKVIAPAVAAPRVAALPSPLSSAPGLSATPYAPPTAPATAPSPSAGAGGVSSPSSAGGPAAQLLGIRPYPNSGAPLASPTPTAPGTHEQHRPGLH